MTKKAIQFFLVGLVVVTFGLTALAAGPIDIKWDKPAPMADRIAGQGPVEVIPADYDDYGVKLSGKKVIKANYVLTILQQSFTQMGANKSCTAGYENSHKYLNSDASRFK